MQKTIPKAEPEKIGDWVDFKDLREKVREWAYQNLVGKSIFNASFGKEILISKQGIKHDTGRFYDPTDLKFLALTVLPKIIVFGTYLRSEKDKLDRLDIVAVHIFESKVQIYEQIHSLWFRVRETKEGNFFYDHAIEKA